MSKKKPEKKKENQPSPSSQQPPVANSLTDQSQTQEKEEEKGLTPPQLVEEWLIHTKAPQHIKKAWDSILSKVAEALDKDVSTHSPNSQSLQKILERLDSIEKQVQKQNTKPTYAQAAQKTVGQEIPVPTRIHSEITIRPGTQTGQLPNRKPAQLMEALKKKTPLFCQKEIRAARKLPSGDIIFILFYLILTLVVALQPCRSSS